jgi:septal ring factor EnvC (AmiA/AmiB activator)
MHAYPRSRLLVAFVALLMTAGAHAQVARSGGGGDQRVVQQMQQLAQERTALQTENAKLKKDLEQAQADLKAARAERDASKARLAAASAPRPDACGATEQSLAQSRTKLEELVARYRETAQTLQAVEAEKVKNAQLYVDKSRSYDACAKANVGLAELANDALGRYEAAAARRSEPFTRLSRIRVENLVDESRQHLEELKVVAPPAPAPPNR